MGQVEFYEKMIEQLSRKSREASEQADLPVLKRHLQTKSVE